jgi:hypothetical protein
MRDSEEKLLSPPARRSPKAKVGHPFVEGPSADYRMSPFDYAQGDMLR